MLIDLYVPRQTDIRQFDPRELGRLDTEMWRSYYDRHPVRLFSQLAGLLRTQYHAPFFRSNLMAYYAAKAALVFKEGHNRAEYTHALPHLINFYAAIERMSTTPFNVEDAASLELEWWIIHRQRATHQSGDLEKVLAETAAAIYHVSPARMMDYARLRGRSHCASVTKVPKPVAFPKPTGPAFQQLLYDSWQSFRKAVN